MKLEDLINFLRSECELEIFENTYIKSWDPKCNDISTEIKFEGRTLHGRGCDSDSSLALTKSIFESIERCLIDFNDLSNSNGVALSHNLEFSMESSKNELCERHLFLTHWLEMDPYFPYSSPESEEYLVKFKSLFPNNINLSFYTTHQVNGIPCIITLISGENFETPFGCVVGLSYNSDFRKSLEHSFFEAYGSFSHAFLNNLLFKNLALTEFEKIKSPNFKDHGKLALNYDYFSRFQYLFPKNNFKSKIRGNNIIKNFGFQSLKVPFFQSLKGIRCYGSGIADLYCGFATGYPNNLPHLLD